MYVSRIISDLAIDKEEHMMIKKILSYRVVLLSFFWIMSYSTTVIAATYYVDNNHLQSNDSNSGTAAMPWEHCPGMEDWSGSAILSAGDIVYFDSSDTWNHDNTSSNHFLWITGGVQYIGDEWGGGTRAKFTMDVSFPDPPGGNNHMLVAWFEDDPVHETVFKGFEIDFQEQISTGIGMNFASGSAWDSRAEGDLVGAIKRIQNCYLHNHYNIDQWNYPIILQTGPYSLTGWNVSNVEIIDNIITDTLVI